jgi:hypothetical protein
MRWLIPSLLAVAVLLLAYLVYKANLIETALTPHLQLIATLR